MKIMLQVTLHPCVQRHLTYAIKAFS